MIIQNLLYLENPMARPVKFNRETALLSAMQLFWERGYGASSMSDLVVAMDMRPGSIYATFGSKRELLFEAINHYGSTNQEQIRKTLLSSSTVRVGFEQMFSQMIQEMVSDKVVRGCLLVNILLELGALDKEAGALAQNHLNGLREIFVEALSKAGQAGEVCNSKASEQSATFLMGSAYSLRVMARAGASLDELSVYMEQSLLHVFGAALSS